MADIASRATGLVACWARVPKKSMKVTAADDANAARSVTRELLLSLPVNTSDQGQNDRNVASPNQLETMVATMKEDLPLCNKKNIQDPRLKQQPADVHELTCIVFEDPQVVPHPSGWGC